MMRPILVMKDVHAVQQPHVAVEHATQHQEKTATANTTSTTNATNTTTSITHHNESPAPLLNTTEARLHEEKSEDPIIEEESITVHVGNNAQQRPPLLMPSFSTQSSRDRLQRNRTRRF